MSSIPQRLRRWLTRMTGAGAPDPAVPPWIQEHENALPGEMTMANRAFKPAARFYRRTRFGDDHRLKYLLYFLDVRDWRVLELGPLSCHHSLMLEKLGAREIVAVEGREANYRQCLAVKQAYRLDRTVLVKQNIEALYDGQAPLFSGPFDLVFCCGLFYHLPDPGKALAWFRAQSPRLFLATHYVEPAASGAYAPELFSPTQYDFAGRTFRALAFREGGPASELSGLSPGSIWLYEKDLLELVKGAGYGTVEVLGKDMQGGLPHITILAE